MKKYKTIINGATFLGMAYAACDPENTLIIEKGNLLGSDIYPCLRLDSVENYFIEETLTNVFARNIASIEHMMYNNLIVTSEIMPLLGKFVEEHKIKILFDCDVIDSSYKDNKYSIGVISRDQTFNLSSTHYINTCDYTSEEYAYSLNILVKHEGEKKLRISNAIYSELGNNICNIEVPLKNNKLDIARGVILDHFTKPCIHSDRLLHIADSICLRRKSKKHSNGKSIAQISVDSNNIFEAMDRGVALWRYITDEV